VEFTADPRSKNVNENGLNGTTADIAGWPYQNYECVALPAELPRLTFDSAALFISQRRWLQWFATELLPFCAAALLV